ncbi:hypothetical protein LINPERHAP1_LOCUS29506, partial [Linum perenne]
IRDRTINIDGSNGRFGSDFRLEVTLEGSMHYVFVEADQLQWLEGVLSAAESSKWVLPESRVIRSSRRSIVVSSFIVKGVPHVEGGGGMCFRLEGEEVIVVEEEGVQARREFLSKCLVMRFVGERPFRWDEFWSWMTKAWGIPMESVLIPIGDDL